VAVSGTEGADVVQTPIGLGRDARLHLAALAVVGVSFYGLFVVSFNLYLVRLGYATSFIGTLGALGTLLFVALSLPASSLGRRWGSRRALLVGTGAYTVGFSLIGFTDMIAVEARTPFLVGSYLLAYLGGPFFWVNSTLYLMAVTTPAQRLRAFALRTALVPFAGVVGSLLAGVVPQVMATVTASSLDDPAPYRAALLLSGALYLVAVATTALSRDEARVAPATVAHATAAPATVAPAGSSATARGRSRAGGGATPWALVLVLTLVEVLRRAGELGALAFANIYFDARLGAPPVVIGAVASLALAASGAAALATPRIGRRLGVPLTATLAMAASAVGLVAMATPTPATAYLGYVLVLASSAVSMSALSVYRMEAVASASWPLMSGATVTGQGLGESVAMGLGGIVIERAGFLAHYLAAAAAATAATIVFAGRFLRRSRGDAPPSDRAADA
jgi:hypothetical protein